MNAGQKLDDEAQIEWDMKYQPQDNIPQVAKVEQLRCLSTKASKLHLILYKKKENQWFYSAGVWTSSVCALQFYGAVYHWGVEDQKAEKSNQKLLDAMKRSPNCPTPCRKTENWDVIGGILSVRINIILYGADCHAVFVVRQSTRQTELRTNISAA